MLEPFPLEPMISCPTGICSGRSRCLPNATSADDLMHIHTVRITMLGFDIPSGHLQPQAECQAQAVSGSRAG